MTQPVIYILDPFGGSTRAHNPAMPHIYGDDAGITRGDGVVETLLVTGGEIANLKRHADRFARSAASLDLSEPDMAAWEEASREAVAQWAQEQGQGVLGDARLQWCYTRGRSTTGHPSTWLRVTPAPVIEPEERISGINVVTASRGYTVATGADAAPWHAEPAKTINYAANMAALRWAREQGAQDLIFTEPGTGHVQEATTSAVVLVKAKQKLHTPQPGPGLLQSTSQAALFQAAEEAGWKTKSRDITVDDLVAAESVWLISSVRGGVRVSAINGTELPAPDNAEQVANLIQEALARP